MQEVSQPSQPFGVTQDQKPIEPPFVPLEPQPFSPQPVPEPIIPEAPLNYNSSALGDPEKNTKGTARKILSLVIALVLLASAILGSYYLWQRFDNRVESSTGTSQDENQDTEVGTNQDTQVYTNAKYAFKLSYPKDVNLREDQEDIFLTKLGSTQKEGTELYDGVWLTLTPGSLGDASVKELVDARIKELSSSTNITVTKQPELVSVVGKTAYRFDVEGVGTYVYYYFSLGPDNYIVVVDGTRDPENQGYGNIVDDIIRSIEFVGTSTNAS